MAFLRRWVLAIIVKCIELNLPHYVINKDAKAWAQEQLVRWIHRRKM